eukprot:4224784-Lingulodinium_polyedra.AAC.1
MRSPAGGGVAGQPPTTSCRNSGSIRSPLPVLIGRRTRCVPSSRSCGPPSPRSAVAAIPIT